MNISRPILYGVNLTDAQEFELVDIISSHAVRLGFEYYSFVLRIPQSLTRPKIQGFDNYSENWRVYYARNECILTDPAIQQAMRSSKPVVWTEKLYQQNKILWQELRRDGHSVGITQSCWGPQSIAGFLSFSRGSGAISKAELSELEPELRQLSLSLFTQVYDLYHLDETYNAEDQIITLREREILRWTGDGKTAEDISIILNITPRTVHFHMNNVLNKLIVSNKVHAVMKAHLIGLL
ncbi:MAG: autoinducer binding domain-containing protein [Brucellaceae bacterium]|jgi:LuxR family transcriptional regulator/LuxR family quorum-sensing system transcriptional regulator SolR|nr:autoinducer binding domain-containing protein [Brucellaceae bacterium]